MRVSLVLLWVVGCTDNTLTVTRYAPEVEIFSHGDGATVLEGQVQRLQGAAIDNDDPPERLSAVWSTNVRELCAAAPVGDDGVSTCEAALTPDDISVSLVVTDDDNQRGDDHLSLVVVPTDAPTVELLSPVTDGVYYSDRLITFEALVGDAEDAPTELTLAWESSLAGALDIATAVDAAGHATAAGSLAEGEHYLTLTVTDTTGKAATDSVVFEVGPPNTAPTCGITAPDDGSYAQLGDAVSLEGRVGDVDIGAPALTVTWTSDKDGLLGTSLPDSIGDVVLSTATLTSGTHTVSLTATDELGLVCSDFIQLIVSSPPEIVVNLPLDEDVYQEGEGIVFDADVVDAEDDAEDLTVAWVSTLDGTFSLEGADPSGRILFSESGLSAGAHTILVTVTDTSGLYTRESFDIHVNGAPSAPTVSLSPDPALTDDALTANLDSPSTDPDGDPITYTYAWSVDGAASTASTSAILPASATTRGERWQVEVTPNDGLVDGPSGTAALTIGNSEPALTSVAITPDPAGAADTLTCTWTGWADADGDADASTLVWEVNGTAVGTGTTLAGAFGSGDTVSCTVTPDDGTDTGTALSDSLVIGNTAPEIVSVTLSPNPPDTDDTLSTAVSSTDADGDTVRYSYAWAINGTATTATASGLAGSTWFDVGDTVTVTVTPYDGSDYGAPVSASVTVDNSVPTAPTVDVTPDSPSSSDDLLCEVTVDSADADTSDVITYSFAWTVDGVAYTAATTTYETGDTIPGSVTDRGEVWTCTVTPDDGTVSGATGSDSVTIGTGSCDSPGLSGTYGTSWSRLANAPNYLFSLMTWKGDDMDYVWNAYGSNLSYYDPATNTWTSVSSSTPCTGTWNSMAPYDGDLWMMRCGNVYKYEIAADTWTSMATFTGSDDYNQTVADCDGHIWGHTGAGNIVEYDVATDTVSYYNHGHGSLYETRLAYDPTEDAVYFGGFSTGPLYRMDASTHAFTTMTPHPEGFHNDIFCGDWSGHLYTAGGSSGTSLWQYDMGSDAWATITSFPVDHGNNGSCTVGTDGYLYMADYITTTFYRLAVY